MHSLYVSGAWLGVTPSMDTQKTKCWKEIANISKVCGEEVRGRWNELMASREATSFFHIALNLGKVLFTFGS